MYSVREAALKLGLTDRHVRFLLAKGMIAGKRLGHDWVVLSLHYDRRRKPKARKKDFPGGRPGQETDEIWMEGSL